METHTLHFDCLEAVCIEMFPHATGPILQSRREAPDAAIVSVIHSAICEKQSVVVNVWLDAILTGDVIPVRATVK
jgi:hypothetical protein